MKPSPEMIKIIRCSILQAALTQYPGPLFSTGLKFVLQELDLSPDAVTTQIHYLKRTNPPLITVHPINVLGRETLKIELTSRGYDIASGIDPDNPVLPEVL